MNLALDGGSSAAAARAFRARGGSKPLQGGIHPHYTGDTYLSICRAIKSGRAGLAHPRVLAARNLAGSGEIGVSVRILAGLKVAGLRLAAGTRRISRRGCARYLPDKVTTAQWIDVVAARHGSDCDGRGPSCWHVDEPGHWARHLRHIRRCRRRRGGLPNLLPLPVRARWRRDCAAGQRRFGPTFREAGSCTGRKHGACNAH